MFKTTEQKLGMLCNGMVIYPCINSERKTYPLYLPIQYIFQKHHILRSELQCYKLSLKLLSVV